MNSTASRSCRFFPLTLLTALLLCASGERATAQVSQNVTRLGNAGRTVTQSEVYRAAPDLDYLLFLPEDTRARVDGRYPMILSLSGIGERGSDLSILRQDGLPSMLDGWNSFPFVVVSPQCPITTQWYIDRTDTLIRRLVEQVVRDYPVDPERIYVTGYSMGGIAAWDMAARHSDLFAAVVPIAARREPGPSFCNLRDIPVWAFHGTDDAVVPFSLGRGAVNIFRSCGGNARFTVYQNVGHVSWPRAYDTMAVYEWMLAQRRPVTRSVAADGSLVFADRGGALTAWNFDDAGTPPVRLGELSLPVPLSVLATTAIGGTRVLVAGGDSLLALVDAADPVAMSPLWMTGDAGTPTAAVFRDDTTLVVAGDHGVGIWSLADPAAPAALAAIDTIGATAAVAVSNSRLAATSDGRLHLFDISAPAAPAHLASWSGVGNAPRALAFADPLLFVGDDNDGLRIVDITDPAAPDLLAARYPGDRVFDLHLADSTLYAAVTDSGVRILDVSLPAQPVELSRWASPGRPLDLAIGGIPDGTSPHLFVAGFSAGVQAVDVADPANPRTVAALTVAPPVGGGGFGRAYASAVGNGLAAIAWGWDGLKLADVSDPAAPRLLGRLDTPGDARGVALGDGYAYVADGDAGVRVIDIADPDQPVEIATLLTGRVRAVERRDTLLYLAAGDSGLVVVSVADPAHPRKMATRPVHFGTALAGDATLAALAGDGRVTLFDLADPAAPMPRGTIEGLRGFPEGIALAGNHLAVPDRDTLRLYDITDRDAPVQSGRAAIGSTAFDVALADGFAWVAAGEGGVRVFDIANPAAPVLAGFYDGPAPARGVSLADGIAYVAEERDGLSLYRFDGTTGIDPEPAAIPGEFALEQNYPNPFNPETRVEFGVATAGWTTLVIYDVLGRTVRTLVDERVSAGRHVIQWDGRDDNGRAVASGVYLYRLQAGTRTAVRKMVLMR